MARKYFTTEQIISKLREAEVLLSQGKSAAEASRAIGINEQSYYRWRKEYGGVSTEQVHCVLFTHLDTQGCLLTS